MAEVIHIKGLRELDQVLQQFPEKYRKNVMRGAMRAGMNVVKPDAQSRIRNRSGLLAKGLRVSTKVQGSRVLSRLRATGRHRSIAHLVEYGTKAHIIRPRKGKFLYFGGRFLTQIQHPGARPYPFMRPALDKNKGTAVMAVAEYSRNRLATQKGIDVPEVRLEGDE